MGPQRTAAAAVPRRGRSAAPARSGDARGHGVNGRGLLARAASARVRTGPGLGSSAQAPGSDPSRQRRHRIGAGRRRGWPACASRSLPSPGSAEGPSLPPRSGSSSAPPRARTPSPLRGPHPAQRLAGRLGAPRDPRRRPDGLSSSSGPSCARRRHGVDLAHLRPRARGRARSRDPERVRRPGLRLGERRRGLRGAHRANPSTIRTRPFGRWRGRTPTDGRAGLKVPANSSCLRRNGADDVLQRRSRGDSRSPPMSRDRGGVMRMAEEVGFEPTVRLRARRFSRPVRSTAPPLLQTGSSVTRPSGAAKPGRRGARADPNGLGGAGSWPGDARRLSSAPAGRERDMRSTLA